MEVPDEARSFSTKCEQTFGELPSLSLRAAFQLHDREDYHNRSMTVFV